jgi:tellurite resistance-related uncharacterized protein
MHAITLSEAPEWEEKAWGATKCLVRGNNFEVHELHAKKGGFSSRHQHRKWNRFHVMAGKLKVEEFTPPAESNGRPVFVADRILDQGDFYEVAPEKIHRFVALEDSHVLEVYWQVAIDPNDIRRFDEGGLYVDVQSEVVPPRELVESTASSPLNADSCSLSSD